MSYRDENGKFRIPQLLTKRPTINAKNREIWQKRTMIWKRKKLFFDQDIKTGICYFCTKEGMKQKHSKTSLHHIKYDNQDPLLWTIEVCLKCHFQIDRDRIRRNSYSKS